MTGVFAGMAGVLSAAFGDVVTYMPKGGAPREIQSIFRAAPIEIEGADGTPIVIAAPTWRVSRDLVPELARDDRIDPGQGKIYRLATIHPSGSPAADALILCELKEV
ncbi:hypothetical protein ABEB22_00375 [Thioclava sp. 'Guangxiensis']|uniref:head-tail joining protein n=1 Tax=Thioclava sp. 'Guangxiensis' TaxID=3149044 RepID=UPI003877D8AB